MSGDNRRIWPGHKGVALVAVALTATLAGAGAGVGVASASARAASARLASSLVPLRQVGLGWSVAEYTTATVGPHPTKGKTTLYAVSPQGRKYPFYTWPAAKPSAQSFFLVDWSGDGQRVLVANLYRYEQISLATGKVIGSFKLPTSANVIGYTRPHGLNLLVANNGIFRYDLTGHIAAKLVAHSSSAIESPDGTSVIVSTSSGLEQVSNVGGVIKRLRAPAGVVDCNPVRWWNAATVLGDCFSRRFPGEPRLWLFPVSGGRVTALTAQRTGHSEDLGDIDAWKLTSGVYLQALGPCGVVFIATQSPNGSARQVVIPGVHYASDLIVTGHGASLLVDARNGCQAGASLVWFNPHTKKVTWVLHGTKNGIGLESVVPFGRPVS